MKPLRNLPIRSKLIIIIMTVTLSTMLLISIGLTTYNIHREKQNLAHYISSISVLLANRSSAALVFDDRTLASENLSALKDITSIEAACIYLVNGEIFSTYAAGQIACPQSPILLPNYVSFLPDSLIVIHAIELNNEVQGYLRVQASLESIDNFIQQQIIVICASTLLATVLALWLSSRLQRIISKPISDIAQTATEVQERSDYSRRAADTGKDEIATLAKAFNAMLETIAKQRQALLKSKDDLELMVESRTRELATSNRELESFSYSVSHDLRAPLRTIDGFSQVILEDYGHILDNDGKAHIVRVRSAAQRMGELIDDLLNLSRITRKEIFQEQVSLSTEARDTIARLSETYPHHKPTVLIQDDLNATGDATLLRILLDNLLGNAWKYTGKTAHANIEFGAYFMGGGPVYYVRDNGVGFDQRYVDKLFVAFQRLHRAEDFEGTGIGLATVSRIIKRHGGNIWAEGTVNHGATFYFTLNRLVDVKTQLTSHAG